MESAQEHGICTQETKNRSDFSTELVKLINRYSQENVSDTPDRILAQYMMNCLTAFEFATKERDSFYGVGNRS